MRYTGFVVRHPFAQGSKSEREAVFLRTEDGEFVLRQQGGNSFDNPDLAKWTGQRVGVEATRVGYTLIATEITPLPASTGLAK